MQSSPSLVNFALAAKKTQVPSGRGLSPATMMKRNSKTCASGMLLLCSSLFLFFATAHSADSPNIMGRVVAFEYELNHSKSLSSTNQWWKKDDLLIPVLTSAEEAYQVDLQRRDLLLGEKQRQARFEREHTLSLPGLMDFINIMLTPLFSCPVESKIGTLGDGGKWVCLSHFPSINPKPVMLSIGCNGETSFEEGLMKQFGVATHTLDFSLKEDTVAAVSALRYIKFYPVGLAAASIKDSIGVQYKATFHSIPEVLDMIKAKYVDIFKIDCEGCEYGVVQDMGTLYDRDTVPFGQILMEVHRIGSVAETFNMFMTLEKLGFRMYHQEFNPAAVKFGGGTWWYEVSYIHEKLLVWGKQTS